MELFIIVCRPEVNRRTKEGALPRRRLSRRSFQAKAEVQRQATEQRMACLAYPGQHVPLRWNFSGKS